MKVNEVNSVYHHNDTDNRVYIFALVSNTEAICTLLVGNETVTPVTLLYYTTKHNNDFIDLQIQISLETILWSLCCLSPDIPVPTLCLSNALCQSWCPGRYPLWMQSSAQAIRVRARQRWREMVAERGLELRRAVMTAQEQE